MRRNFHEYVNLLKKHKRDHGHCRPTIETADQNFIAWVKNQRNFLRRRVLEPQRIATLEAIEFDWDHDWSEKYDELKNFYKKHDNWVVPVDSGIAYWIKSQWEDHKSSQLSFWKLNRLNKINFFQNTKPVFSRTADWQQGTLDTKVESPGTGPSPPVAAAQAQPHLAFPLLASHGQQWFNNENVMRAAIRQMNPEVVRGIVNSFNLHGGAFIPPNDLAGRAENPSTEEEVDPDGDAGEKSSGGGLAPPLPDLNAADAGTAADTGRRNDSFQGGETSSSTEADLKRKSEEKADTACETEVKRHRTSSLLRCARSQTSCASNCKGTSNLSEKPVGWGDDQTEEAQAADENNHVSAEPDLVATAPDLQALSQGAKIHVGAAETSDTVVTPELKKKTIGVTISQFPASKRRPKVSSADRDQNGAADKQKKGKPKPKWTPNEGPETDWLQVFTFEGEVLKGAEQLRVEYVPQFEQGASDDRTCDEATSRSGVVTRSNFNGSIVLREETYLGRREDEKPKYNYQFFDKFLGHYGPNWNGLKEANNSNNAFRTLADALESKFPEETVVFDESSLLNKFCEIALEEIEKMKEIATIEFCDPDADDLSTLAAFAAHRQKKCDKHVFFKPHNDVFNNLVLFLSLEGLSFILVRCQGVPGRPYYWDKESPDFKEFLELKDKLCENDKTLEQQFDAFLNQFETEDLYTPTGVSQAKRKALMNCLKCFKMFLGRGLLFNAKRHLHGTFIPMQEGSRFIFVVHALESTLSSHTKFKQD